MPKVSAFKNGCFYFLYPLPYPLFPAIFAQAFSTKIHFSKKIFKSHYLFSNNYLKKSLWSLLSLWLYFPGKIAQVRVLIEAHLFRPYCHSCESRNPDQRVYPPKADIWILTADCSFTIEYRHLRRSLVLIIWILGFRVCFGFRDSRFEFFKKIREICDNLWLKLF